MLWKRFRKLFAVPWLKRRDLRQPEYMTEPGSSGSSFGCVPMSSSAGDDWLFPIGLVNEWISGFMMKCRMKPSGVWIWRKALQILGHPYRDVILLKYQEDMTLTEIAKVMNKPSGTVKSWLHRALEKLRCHLKSSEKGGDTHEEKQYGS